MNEWEELNRYAEEHIGKEKGEEIEKGVETISILLKEDADISFAALIFAVGCGAIPMEKAIWTNFLAGAGMYRELMIGAGVDVEAIERKLIDAKKNK